jgi:hypothetical protein
MLFQSSLEAVISCCFMLFQSSLEAVISELKLAQGRSFEQQVIIGDTARIPEEV